MRHRIIYQIRITKLIAEVQEDGVLSLLLAPLVCSYLGLSLSTTVAKDRVWRTDTKCTPTMATGAASGTVTLPRETIALLEREAVAKGVTVDELAHDTIQASLSQSTVRKAAKAAYTPQTHLRQRALIPKEAALLFIDVQNYNCHRSGWRLPTLER